MTDDAMDTIRLFEKKKKSVKWALLLEIALLVIAGTLLVVFRVEPWDGDAFEAACLWAILPAFALVYFLLACPKCRKKGLNWNQRICPKCQAVLSAKALAADPAEQKLKDPYFLRLEIEKRRALKKTVVRIWGLSALSMIAGLSVTFAVTSSPQIESGKTGFVLGLGLVIAACAGMVVHYVFAGRLVACPHCHEGLLKDPTRWWFKLRSVASCDVCGVDVQSFIGEVFGRAPISTLKRHLPAGLAIGAGIAVIAIYVFMPWIRKPPTTGPHGERLIPLVQVSPLPHGSPLPEPEELRGAVKIQVNPMIEFDGKTRAEIYSLRESYVRQCGVPAPAQYAPSPDVFGQIVDGRPWWGLYGMYLYRNGPKAAEGPSVESRSVANPCILFSLRESFAYDFGGPPRDQELSNNLVAEELAWNAQKRWARVVYPLGPYFGFFDRRGFRTAETRRLDIVTYNARDLGYAFAALRRKESQGADMPRVADGKAIGFPHFLHVGQSCRIPGGCNNVSPGNTVYTAEIRALPARLTFSLWKAEPKDVAQPSDLTFVMDFR